MRYIILIVLLSSISVFAKKEKRKSTFVAVSLGLGQSKSLDDNIPNISSNTVFTSKIEYTRSKGMPFTVHMPLFHPFLEYQFENLYSERIINSHSYLGGFAFTMPMIIFSTPFVEGGVGYSHNNLGKNEFVGKIGGGLSLYLGDFIFERNFKETGSSSKFIARMRFVIFGKTDKRKKKHD